MNSAADCYVFIMKVMVWQFMSDSHMVMTALIVTCNVLWSFLWNLISIYRWSFIWLLAVLIYHTSSDA
jgi:hypothetical protein